MKMSCSTRRRLCAVLLMFLLPLAYSAQGTCFAQNASAVSVSFPPIKPLFEVPADHEIQPLEMLIYAFAFSDCEALDFDPYTSRFLGLCEKVRSRLGPQDGDYEKGRAVLAVMYEDVLTQYDEDQTRMDVMFDGGTYNCVSSCVLYYLLARQLGLDVSAWRTLTHVFCMVNINGTHVVVETTNPDGYDNYNAVTYTTVSKEQYESAFEVTERVLVSYIGKNLSSIYMEEGEDERAMSISLARYRFVTDGSASDVDEARLDFEYTVVNYAVRLSKQNLHEAAVAWMDMFINKYGLSSYIIEKNDSLVYNYVVSFLMEDDLANAVQAFNSHSAVISSAMYLRIQYVLYIPILEDAVSDMDYPQAVETLRKARKDAFASDKNIASQIDTMLEKFWYLYAVSVAKEGEWLEASGIAAKGLEDVPSSQNLASLREQCLYNHAVVVHNSFVEAMSSGDAQKARDILEKGLEDNPQSALLKNDLNSLTE